MIGIHAPYAFLDRTYMALSLAELAGSWGLKTSLFVSGTPERGVDSFWDDRVVTGGQPQQGVEVHRSRGATRQQVAFYQWADRCESIIWLAPSLNRHILTHQSTSHILVTGFPQPFVASPAHAGRHFLVCPNTALAEALSRVSEKTVVGLDWSSHRPIVQRAAESDSSHLQLYVPVQGAAARRYGALLFYALEALLGRFPGLQITVAYFKRWTRSALEASRDVIRRGKGRIRLSTRPSLAQQRSSMAQADWVFYPYHFDDVLWPLVEALHAGTPVITFDTLTARRLVIPDHNGHLIPCRLLPGIGDLPLLAEPRTDELIDGLTRALSSDVSHFRGRPWPELARRQAEFLTNWQSYWGVPAN